MTARIITETQSPVAELVEHQDNHLGKI